MGIDSASQGLQGSHGTHRTGAFYAGTLQTHRQDRAGFRTQGLTARSEWKGEEVAYYTLQELKLWK